MGWTFINRIRDLLSTVLRSALNFYKKEKVRIFTFVLLCCLFLVCFIVYCNVSITNFNKTTILSEAEQLPHQKVALVLGTSKYLVKGGINQFYQHRIDAAVELYAKGIVDYLLVSGDNRVENYNEPQTMKNDLEARGVPSDSIILDYAGFRTLDSVVRAHKVFGLSNLIIVSQRFHLERALFLAHYEGIHAIGYEAQGVKLKHSLKVMFRESLARVKVYLDLLFKVEPHFLGEPICIPLQKDSVRVTTNKKDSITVGKQQ